MDDVNIPEELNRSFEELWQQYGPEIEQTETAALNSSLDFIDGAPIIKVDRS
jgi:hypothetical protein